AQSELRDGEHGHALDVLDSCPWDRRNWEWRHLRRRVPELLTFKGHAMSVWSVCFSPDGRHLASASEDRSVKIWDGHGGQQLLTLKGHTHLVSSVCFSPDGKRLASASWDKSVKLWDVRSGQTLSTFDHTGAVGSVCFSPDGQRLASASDDG